MTLPIELIPNSNPPKFRWQQIVDTPAGLRTVSHIGVVPLSIENSLIRLVKLTMQQAQEIIGLRRQVEGMADRIAAQSELLSKQAEAKPDPPVATKKGK